MKYDDNLTAKLPSFVTHLECAMTGEHYEADQIHNLSRANKPLLVRYDLPGVAKALTKDKLARRAPCHSGQPVHRRAPIRKNTAQ